MRVYRKNDQLDLKPQKVFLTIGNFDGVHIGHKEVLQHVVTAAKANNAISLVMVFDPHPRTYFDPENPQHLITTIGQRIELMENLGVDAVIVQEFSSDFANMNPESFIKDYLVDSIGITNLFVSNKFLFGHKAAGDINTLQRYADEYSYSVTAIENISFRHMTVSSSFIRTAIQDGEMELVRHMLGRPYYIEGEVYPDTQRGSSLLDTPTSNIVPRNELLPAHGIYAGIATLHDGSRYQAATYVGTRPTFEGLKTVFETHIIGFEGSLYGENLLVDLYRKTRADKKFDTLDELGEQIKLDVDEVKAFFQRHRDDDFAKDLIW